MSKTIKFKNLLEKFENLEVEVDENKIDILTKFLTHCAVKGLLKRHSPQFTYLLRETMEFSKNKGGV